jgi:nitronate monooxygenase
MRCAAPSPMSEKQDMAVTGSAEAARRLPALIQGGMGVSVSHWRLARTVSMAGGLGVISGTALDRVVACRLQEGDTDGNLRRVIAQFPISAVAERVLARWYVAGGITRPGGYRQTPMMGHQPSLDSLELLVVANFAEITLAKEGHDGKIGINLLEKIQIPNLASLYGAMMAGVDAVLMGAGIPREIPGALDRMAMHEEASLILRVEGALAGETTRIRFAPCDVVGPPPHPPLTRPPFLAVITSDTLAQSLLRSTDGGVDGFVVEGPIAGGHNAPPRGWAGQVNERGEPIYGPRDAADLERLRKLGRPYWLAGGFGTMDGMARAQALGAQGVQMGTAFAFSMESGLAPELKSRVLDMVQAGTAQVFTDPLASPTGFPFKVVEVPGTISDPQLYAKRTRVCNLGYLRQAYRLPDGSVGWRCPAEPDAHYIAKGGAAADLAGRKCLCNALMASAGHALTTAEGGRELPIITAGDSLTTLAEHTPRRDYSATELCTPKSTAVAQA